jgi:hypothetical protein
MLISSRSSILAAGLLALAAPGGTAQAAQLQGAFDGNAYASFTNAKAGQIGASLDRSAFVSCTCEGTNGKTVTKEVNAVKSGDDGKVLGAKATIGTTFTQKTDSTAEVKNTSTINGLNALGGMITADNVSASADVSATASTMTPSSAGSGFTNLKIAGQSFPDQVAPNTAVPLPGIGTVTLNKVTTQGGFHKSGQILVEMMAIDVTDRNNSLGIPNGSKIVIAHAAAAFTRDQPAYVFNGQAYASVASGAAGNDLENRIGKAAPVSIDCAGTNGKTISNSLNGLAVSGLMSAGDTITTAFAGPEGDAQVARTTASVANLSMLGGLITAPSIQAVAQDSIQGGNETASTDGSGFSGLTVAGVAVPVDAPPNTALPLPGIGTVVVNEQIVKNNGNVTVNGLHITVTSPNSLGMPVGSELIIAHANAAARPF